jgi:anti-sigma factor RsiW
MYQDLVAAHVDRVLTPAECHEVERHLSSCQSCRRLYAQEQRFHTAFVARRFLVPVPAEVERRLRGVLAAESEPQRHLWKRLVERLTTILPLRLTLGLAAAGLLFMLLLPRLLPLASEPGLFTLAAEQYQTATADPRVFAYETEDPRKLQIAFNSSGQLDFTTHVLDLRSIGYRLRGGSVIRTKGRPTAVAVYDRENGYIVCLRQHGMMPPLPSGAERIQSNYVYTQAGYTIVFVQNPGHFCLLVSRLPREVFLRTLASLSAEHEQ